MAAGDVKAASVNADGFSIDITMDTMGTGGTYDFGFGANNDPANCTMTLSLTSEGYSNSGVLGTTGRTLYGTEDVTHGAMRLPHPNEASPDETAAGADVVIRVALSQGIYDDDTNITIDVDAGWYTEGGTPSNLVTGFSVTNNSTLDYPKVIGNWGEVQKEIVTGNFNVEFLAFHGYADDNGQVACVKFTATDEHANSVNYTVTSMSLSGRADYGKVVAYIQAINVSTLTSEDMITIEAQAYPRVGDANSVLDTDDAVNAFPTPLYTNLLKRLYKSNEYGHCVLDSTSGNDGTASVYTTQVAAEAAHVSDPTNAYVTFAGALGALQTYHNANFSRNHSSGGYIYCTEDTHGLNTYGGGTGTEWTTITKMSTAAKSNVIVQAPAANSGCPTYCKIADVTVTTSNGWYPINRYMWFDNCDITSTATTLWYDFQYGAFTYNSGSINNELKQYSAHEFHVQPIRGNVMDDKHMCRAWTVIGNKNVGISSRTNVGIPNHNNGIYAYNICMHADVTTTISIATGGGIGDNLDGFAIIQNVLERITTATEPLILLSGDWTTTTTNNIIFFNNTFAGQRANLGYNDLASGPYAEINWFVKNNIFSNYNNKDDTFGDDATAIGCWMLGYAVGHNSNHFRTTGTDEWAGEFYGFWISKGTAAVPLEAGYDDDQSLDGGGGGDGDYHLASSSNLKDFSHDLILPYDIEGTTRVVSGAIGAYEYTATSGVPLKMATLSISRPLLSPSTLGKL